MKAKYTVVFDTNIIISAVIFGGNPRTCLELARTGHVQLVTSNTLLFELAGKLSHKFKWTDNQVADVIYGLGKFVSIVKPTEKIDLIKKDPPDNAVLECARKGKVDYIISGDKKHVLSLKKFENIKIISAQDFLKEYYN